MMAKVVSMFKETLNPELVPSHNIFALVVQPTDRDLLIWWGSLDFLIFNFETRQTNPT
jgi:hypothetical protein